MGACMSVRCVVCCKLEVFRTSWSPVQRSHTDCSTTLCASINILNEDVLVQWELTRQKQTYVFINFVNPFEGLEEFKYLGTTLTNQNFIQVEVKNRLSLGNACYHSVQKLLSPRLLYKNLKIKIYRTIILPFICMGVKVGRWLWGRNVGCGYLWTGCWEEYLVIRVIGNGWMENNYIMRSWKLWTNHTKTCEW